MAKMSFDGGLRKPAVGTGTVLKPGYQPSGIQNAQLQQAPVGTGTVLKRSTSGTAPVSGGGGGGGTQRSVGTSYSGGGGGGGGGFGGVMAAPAAPPMSEGDYLNSDDVYLAALSRYNKNYDDLLADITRRQGDYDVTHGNSLKDLGYLSGEGDTASWDFANQQTAAGRGFQGLIQDFAARGLLHSGDYLNAQNDFTGSLGKQLGAMNLAKQQFGEGLNQERTSGMSARDGGIGQARAEALARMQQLYGGV